MRLIAHRGWSEASGSDNTLAAFARAAADPRVSGVEIDVCRDDAGTLLVSHDPPRGDAPTLTLDAALGYLAGTELELFVELKQTGIAGAAIEALVAAGVAERSVVFAFAEIARCFPWSAARPVRLGAILLYPWTMRRFIAAYHPDLILLGWDECRQPWSRLAFRAWWSVFRLARVTQRSGKPVAVGVVRRPGDLRWLARRNPYASIADMDVIDGRQGSAAPQS